MMYAPRCAGSFPRSQRFVTRFISGDSVANYLWAASLLNRLRMQEKHEQPAGG